MSTGWRIARSRPVAARSCDARRPARSLKLTPPSYDVRSTVHEYGGGAFTVHAGTVFFVNYTDQRIYRQDTGAAPSPITPEDGCRYADLIVDLPRGRLICVREDHRGPGQPTNTIAAVRMDGAGCRVLVSGSDFYSNPRLSPDGAQLAYLTWNHPNMPWDGCELHIENLDDEGEPHSGRLIAGGPSEAIFQPEWSPGGILHFASDSSGWWNLYRWKAGVSTPLCPMPAEFGRAMWSFGNSTYGFANEHRILCCYSQDGADHLAWLDAESGNLAPLESHYTKIDLLRCAPSGAAFVGASPTSPATVVCMDAHTGAFTPVRSEPIISVEGGFISLPVALEWTSPAGHQVYGHYYAPANPDFAPLEAERPPLLVLCHGGPTSAASTALRYPLQYWTSRGFALLDVDYSGSTGYGREYRRRLQGQWGVIDAEDCCAGALFLARQGMVDPRRMAIKGGSAGGFTALSCLTSRNEVFAAGSVYYGIADLELLAQGSHKFELHYLDTLIGPYPGRRDLYLARSPIQNVERLRCPLILFQGDDDRVVPPAQSQLMFDAVKRQGLPTALLRFSGEGHGFRRAKTLQSAQEAELYFFSKIFGFALQDSMAPIHIENLPDQQLMKRAYGRTPRRPASRQLADLRYLVVNGERQHHVHGREQSDRIA